MLEVYQPVEFRLNVADLIQVMKALGALNSRSKCAGLLWVVDPWDQDQAPVLRYDFVLCASAIVMVIFTFCL